MLGIIIYLLSSALLGGLLCFGGKKVYFMFLKVLGVLLCAGVFLGWLGFNWKGLLAAALASALAVLLIEKVYKAGFFLAGAIFGLLLGTFAASLLPDAAAGFGWLPVIGLAIALGICGVVWSELFIVLSTAYNGAGMIAAAVVFLVLNFRNLKSFVWADGITVTILQLNKYLTSEFAGNHAMAIFLLTLLIALAGIAVQRGSKE